MPAPATVEDTVLCLVVADGDRLSITQVMKLVFLADVEHVRLYGDPLCDCEWTWHSYGPFSQAVYQAVEALEARGLVSDVVQTNGQRYVEARGPSAASVRPCLSASQARALDRVIRRHAGSSVEELKQAAYRTSVMQTAQAGERLDVRRESRRSRLPGSGRVAMLRERGIQPNLETWGDPNTSSAEDVDILREFSRLRDLVDQGNP